MISSYIDAPPEHSQDLAVLEPSSCPRQVYRSNEILLKTNSCAHACNSR
jgi:hypothetical protein